MAKKKNEQEKIIIDKEKDILKESEPLLEDEEEDEAEDIEEEETKPEDEEAVDISELENNVAQDEDGNIVIEVPPLEEEEELKRRAEELDTDEEEDSEGENNHIQRIKHLEEVSNGQEKIQISKEEYEKVMARLQTLRTVSRKEIAEKLKTAREFGDLSENSEYEAAKKDQAFVEGEISDFEQRIERMEIIDFYGLTDEVVHIGNVVQAKRLGDGKIFDCRIVGSSYESDISCQPMKIAIDSPVGNGLLRIAVGGVARVKLPHNKVAVFEVLSISH